MEFLDTPQWKDSLCNLVWHSIANTLEYCKYFGVLQIHWSIGNTFEHCKYFWELQILLSIANTLEYCKYFWELKIFWGIANTFECCKYFWELQILLRIVNTSDLITLPWLSQFPSIFMLLSNLSTRSKKVRAPEKTFGKKLLIFAIPLTCPAQPSSSPDALPWNVENKSDAD